MKIVSTKFPYYCIIEHSEQKTIVEYARQILIEEKFEFVRGTQHFRHQRINKHDCELLLKLSPFRYVTQGLKAYASIFSTAPGHYYRAHKDGQTIRAALNYIIDCRDQFCITSWYDNNVEESYKLNDLNGVSRELENFQKQHHQPATSTVFEQDQCILFNTDIYHDFDNTQSSNYRHVLTIRFSQPDDLYWQDIVKEIQHHAS
jgi:hypothetical protein